VLHDAGSEVGNNGSSAVDIEHRRQLCTEVEALVTAVAKQWRVNTGVGQLVCRVSFRERGREAGDCRSDRATV